MDEHFDRLEDFRARRLPGVKGFMVTTGARDSAGLPPTGIMQMGASHLEFWFGENGRQGTVRHRLGSPPDDPAGSKQDLTPADIRLGPADLEMLDALITAGTAASRAEAVSWVLARIRERPAYARLTERARELHELKARF
jgi:hypothetical protein